MCMGVGVTKMTGSSSLALWLHSLLITRSIITLSLFYTSSSHALGFSVSTSRLLATDLNTETSTSIHDGAFLPFLVQSPWNFGTQVKTLLSRSQSQSYFKTGGLTVAVWRHCAWVSCTDTKETWLLECCVTLPPTRKCVYQPLRSEEHTSELQSPSW
jgi:hypothetical protein